MNNVRVIGAVIVLRDTKENMKRILEAENRLHDGNKGVGMCNFIDNGECKSYGGDCTKQYPGRNIKVSKEQCHERCLYGWVCNRPLGHKGNHRAYRSEETRLASWM